MKKNKWIEVEYTKPMNDFRFLIIIWFSILLVFICLIGLAACTATTAPTNKIQSVKYTTSARIPETNIKIISTWAPLAIDGSPLDHAEVEVGTVNNYCVIITQSANGSVTMTQVSEGSVSAAALGCP